MHLPRSMDRSRQHGFPCCAISCSKSASKRVRPGLDDKVLADWNGLMIAALVNAGVTLGRAGLDRHGAPRLRFHCRAHDATATASVIPGAPARLLFPGLASDYAAMIRAALALYEATGERAYLEQALDLAARVRCPLRRSRHRRLLPDRRRRRRPGGAARIRPPTTPRPIRTRWPRRTWCGSPSLTGDAAWRDQGRPADRGHSVGAPRAICSAMSRCSTRSTCVCAPPRSSSPGRTPRRCRRPR